MYSSDLLDTIVPVVNKMVTLYFKTCEKSRFHIVFLLYNMYTDFTDDKYVGYLDEYINVCIHYNKYDKLYSNYSSIKLKVMWENQIVTRHIVKNCSYLALLFINYQLVIKINNNYFGDIKNGKLVSQY